MGEGSKSAAREPENQISKKSVPRCGTQKRTPKTTFCSTVALSSWNCSLFAFCYTVAQSSINSSFSSHGLHARAWGWRPPEMYPDLAPRNVPRNWSRRSASRSSFGSPEDPIWGYIFGCQIGVHFWNQEPPKALSPHVCFETKLPLSGWSRNALL